MNREELLKRLKANLVRHQEIYAAAMVKYREEAIGWHRAQVTSIENGRDVDRVLDLPVPEDHTEDYDAAIQMLTWAVGETVEMDQASFEQLVCDRWAWSPRWQQTTSAYAVS